MRDIIEVSRQVVSFTGFADSCVWSNMMTERKTETYLDFDGFQVIMSPFVY